MKAYLGINDQMYVDTFGFKESGEKSYSFKDKYEYGSSYTQYIVSDAEFIIIYGPIDPSTGKVAAETQRLEFRTLPAGEASQNIAVKVDSKTSMSVRFTVTPDEGIERYRVYVGEKASFAQMWVEGEYMVRSTLIGDPTDKSEEYEASAPFDFDGLTPDTEYTIGVIGFDAQNREKMVFTDFSTTPPTGPVPVIRFEGQQAAEPWRQVQVKVMLEHAVSSKYLLTTAAEFEQVTTGSGVSVDNYLLTMGTPLNDEELSSALDKGIVCESNDLIAATAYCYAFVATNEEGVSVSELYRFTTADAPVSSLRTQLVGRYRAVCTDLDGRRYDFTVEVSDGPNDALKAEYAQKGQLAILGFEPCNIPYASPRMLLDNGWAADEATANANYGPKILLQVNADDTVNTLPATVTENTFAVAVYNGTYLQLKGYATLPSGRVSGILCDSFPIDVSDDRNTLTIGSFVFQESDFWPGIYDGEEIWYGGVDRFRGSDPITLTRIEDEPAPQALAPARTVAPRLVRRNFSRPEDLSRRHRMAATLEHR